MKRLQQLFAIVLTIVLLASCGKNDTAEKKETTLKEDNKILIGVTATPHEEIIKALEEEFKAKGLEVETKVFSDYPLFNTALADGEIDANYFQHEPYFEDFCEEHDLDLVSLGAVHLEPLGFYAKDLTSIDELSEGAEIIIPNDDTNCGRALLLLQENGLITLENGDELGQTEKDVKDNPKNLKITPVDAATAAKTYQDVDGGVINSNYAILEGLNPVEDALVLESTENNPYANIVAVRRGEENSEKYKVLMEVLQSDACKTFIENEYGGSVVPAK
ncbi:MAG: MetQ/NlpA family ABC transporter substrate-binding protein [Tissierellia bacterium]|nr:MetQ/NlpA family ABC transporter substrate-binding protein [Tissierellia bacterium]